MINVMVVDDSLFFQNLLKKVLEDEQDIRVSETAKNGKECIKKLQDAHVDVIVLDINMPVMDGLETLKYVMTHEVIPTIIFSGEIEGDASLSTKALSLGAMSVILKPKFSEIDKISEELITKIRAAVAIDRSNLKRLVQLGPLGHKKQKDIRRVIVIGSSTGGPQALSLILSKIPLGFQHPILIVQHIHPQFTTSLAKTLDNSCSMPIKEGEDGEVIEPGRIYIAPGDQHMTVKNGAISLNSGPKVNAVRPAVDPLFLSAAEEFGDKLIGVILTGMGKDGCEGMQKIKECKGRTLAQSRETSVVFDMPRHAIESGAVDHVVDIEQIADELAKMTGYIER